jgi:hypothetical protein
MVKNRDLIEKIGNEIYNWFNAIMKKIEKKHPSIKWGYEKDGKYGKKWVIYSTQNTVLLKMGYDETNGNLSYEYLADLNGEIGLKPGTTTERKDLLALLPKLEEIDAYER